MFHTHNLSNQKKKDKSCAFLEGFYARCGKRVRFSTGFPSTRHDLRGYYAHFSRRPELGAKLDVYQRTISADRPLWKTEVWAAMLSSSILRLKLMLWLLFSGRGHGLWYRWEGGYCLPAEYNPLDSREVTGWNQTYL